MSRFHELEHAREHHGLKLETTLVVRVRKHEEDILHDTEEVLLEEGVGHSDLGTREVVDNLQTHCEGVSHGSKGA